MSQIKNLVEFTVNDTSNTYLEINFGTLPNFQAQEIKRVTGYQFTGSVKTLTTYSVSHILKKHGAGKETGANQKGITNSDFELIPQILSSPDRYEKGNKPDSVLFCKKIAGINYKIIMQGIDKKNNKKLLVITMYAKK